MKLTSAKKSCSGHFGKAQTQYSEIKGHIHHATIQLHRYQLKLEVIQERQIELKTELDALVQARGGSSSRVVSVSCRWSAGKRTRSPILPCYSGLPSACAIYDRFPESRPLAEKKLKPSFKRRSVCGLSWMGARAVDWARLESVCTARYRGFESLPIRKSFTSGPTNQICCRS